MEQEFLSGRVPSDLKKAFTRAAHDQDVKVQDLLARVVGAYLTQQQLNSVADRLSPRDRSVLEVWATARRHKDEAAALIIKLMEQFIEDWKQRYPDPRSE